MLQFHYASDENGPKPSPAHALVLAFAHLANQEAYWTNDTPGQLWISDLDYQHPQLILTDEVNDYPVKNPPNSDYRLRLTWSPDDMHLVVDAPTGSAPDLIYHVRSKMLEQWPWRCDRVALSLRTERLATWCPSTTGQSRYAVMEWGGEIWYSEQAPATVLVHGIKLSPPNWIEGLVQTWAWSADGQQIAYFDPGDPGGYLHIANAAGERLKTLPSGVKDLSPEHPSLGSEDLQWSQNGQRLLVNAYGTVEHPCPRHLDPVLGDQIEAPCWQVLDTETGTVVWTVSDSAKELMSSVPPALADITKWGSTKGAISPNGNLVALTIHNGALDYGFIMDLETGEIEGIDAPANAMRWGTSP